MVSIGKVWDSTTAAFAGRFGLIAPVAALTLVLPPVARKAVLLALTPDAPVTGLVGALLLLVTGLVTVWGRLAILAIATDPATTIADAGRQATERLLPTIGVALVLTGVAVLLFIPVIVAVAASGIHPQALAAARMGVAALPRLAPALMGFLGLYGLALTAFALWAAARLMPVYAVVLNERRGVGAIGRAIALTRGCTWRLIATILLFLVVLFVATFAAQAVLGLAARLVMGPDHPDGVLFVAAIGAILVTALLAPLAYVFIARFYVAARAAEPPAPGA